MTTQEILARMQEVIDHPNQYVIKWKSIHGGKAIGLMPPFCPAEIVHAAGALPMGLWGASIEPEDSGKYYPAFYCSILTTVLELGLHGKYDELDAVICSTICDGLKNMIENWKSSVKNIEMIGFVLPHNRKLDCAMDFLVEEYINVRDRVEAVTGRKITDFSLARSIKVYNAHRAVMRKFSEVACDHLDIITPTNRHIVYKSAHLMSVEEHIALVEELIANLQKEPVYTFEGIKLLVTGIILDLPDLLKSLEENKIAIVGDDLLQESMQYTTDVPEGIEPLRRLAHRWQNMEGACVIFDPQKSRAQLMIEMAQQRGADGILVCILKFCEPDEFDYPIIKKKFDAAGIPSLYIEIETQSKNDQQAATRIQAFREMLGK